MSSFLFRTENRSLKKWLKVDESAMSGRNILGNVLSLTIKQPIPYANRTNSRH